VLLQVRPTLHRVESGGAVFDVTGEDHIEFNVLCLGAHAPEIVSVLERLAVRGVDVFWDIGANIGSISLPLAARCPALRVYGFEPSPPVLSLFLRNANLNPQLLDRVTILAAALAEETGFLPFHMSSEPFNSGFGGLGTSANRVAHPVNVWTVRGDDLIDRGIVPQPQLMKIDVEGFELEVLKGLSNTLENASKMGILFEHEVYRFEERGTEPDSVVRWLQKIGFSVYSIRDDTTLRPIREGDLAETTDFLALKGWSDPTSTFAE
jgi:FkbM family methyltransferase